MIVRGGENLSPGEIEDVLLEAPGVAEAAVVGIPDTEWGERVVAAVVLDAGAAVGEDELQDHVRAQAPLDEDPRAHRRPRRAALQRDGQAAPPCPARRAERVPGHRPRPHPDLSAGPSGGPRRAS